MFNKNKIRFMYKVSKIEKNTDFSSWKYIPGV